MKIAILLTMLASAVAAAEPTDVTVDDAVALLRARSARLAATRAGVEVSAADVVGADVYPNPEVGLSTAHTASGDTANAIGEYAVDLSIPVLIGGQRGRRIAAAEAHVGVARAEVGVAQGELELEVRNRFAALVAAQERASVLAAALADARGLRSIVAGRATAGAGSPYAVERMELVIASLTSRVDAAKADEADASGELATTVGLPGWHPHAVGDLATVAAAPRAMDPAHPALVLDRATREAARADEARAHAEAVPTPSLGLQSFATTSPSGFGLSFGVTVPLPLFDRNQGAVARARAEEHRAELELAADAAELDAALDRAQRVAAVRRDALAHFQTDAMQRLAGLRTMAESAYRTGQGGIVELIDALDAVTEARLREIELRAAFVEADLAVRRASQGR